MFQHLPGHLLLHLWIDRFWLEGWEEAEGKEKGCRGAELEEMGQTNESDALALCQLPLDSPTQGTTCIKPGCPFLQSMRLSMEQCTFPASQEHSSSTLDLWAAAQLHSWRWGMCSPAQTEKSKHRIIPSPYVTNDVMTLLHLSPQGHILPAGSSHSLSISALRILNQAREKNREEILC